MGHEAAALMLSISGLRGVIGQTLGADVATRYGMAIGTWLTSQYGKTDVVPHVVLGRDSRISGQMVESATVAGLLSTGCKVTSLGIATTPGVAIMVGQLHAQGGIVITASHNPIQWNGIKILNEQGLAPPPEMAQKVIDLFRGPDANLKNVSVEKLSQLQTNHTTARTHVDLLMPLLNVQAIAKRKLKVVLHSVHGAGGPETALMLREMGVELIHLFAEPTGRFPHSPEPTRENLSSLCDAVREHHADIGFAQDPDADRLAIVDENGQYIGEEYTLVLTAKHILQHHRDANRKPILAANLSSSRMIDDVAAEAGATVLRTPVGEANVSAAIENNRALAGGEGNGGIIWPVVSRVRDSLVGVGLMLEMLAFSNKKVSQLVAEIPAYCIIKDKFPIQPGLTNRMGAELRKAFPTEKFDTQDGIRIDWADRWVSVRASNTEPILRIIAEAAKESDARELINRARKTLGI